MGNRIQEGRVRASLEEENNWVQFRFGTEVGTEGNYEVVDGCRGVVCREDYCAVLPVVVVGIPIRSVVTDLEKNQLKFLQLKSS